jgi:hypothetical protein
MHEHLLSLCRKIIGRRDDDLDPVRLQEVARTGLSGRHLRAVTAMFSRQASVKICWSSGDSFRQKSRLTIGMYSPVNCRSSRACRIPDSQNCALAMVSLVVIRPSNVPCDRPSATLGKGVVFGTAPMNRVRHA